jgi:PIN domain nuclease of toxin-antitoxin system
MRVVLDTHALVYWCSQPTRFSPAQQHAVATISEENPAIVADITLWEISALVSGGRLKLDLPLREWLTNATAPPLVRVAEITPSIAHEVEMLSNWENQDPADRLIVATARVYGARLITNDEAMRSLAVVDTI